MLQLFLVNAFSKKNENWPLCKSPLNKPHSAVELLTQIQFRFLKSQEIMLHCINIASNQNWALGIDLIFSNSAALL